MTALTSALAPVPVYAHPPDNMTMPAVTLDRILDEPDDLLADTQARVTITFTIWSRKRGMREIEDIRDAMKLALHDADFTLETGGSVMCRWVRADITRDADGLTYVGSALIQALVED